MGLFSSVGSVLNDLTGASSAAAKAQKYALQSAAINNKYQKEFAQNAHQWETEDLKKAGLNRILSVGGSGASASGGGVSSASAQASGINPIDSVINTINGVQSAKKTASENANIQAQTLATKTDTIGKGIMNKIAEIDLAYKDKKSRAELDNLRQELKNLQGQYDKIIEETKRIKGGKVTEFTGTGKDRDIINRGNDKILKYRNSRRHEDLLNALGSLGF